MVYDSHGVYYGFQRYKQDLMLFLDSLNLNVLQTRVFKH